MAVPKRKSSKARGRSRITAPTLVECPQCHELKRAHAVCENCGYYDGEKKISVKADEKK